MSFPIVPLAAAWLVVQAIFLAGIVVGEHSGIEEMKGRMSRLLVVVMREVEPDRRQLALARVKAAIALDNDTIRAELAALVPWRRR